MKCIALHTSAAGSSAPTLGAKTNLELAQRIRVNIGCGQTPTQGWINIDNSLSLHLAKIPFLAELLLKLKIIGESQYQFIKFARENNIVYGDATKKLPFKDETVDVIYSSHMLEHLDRNEASKFLREAYRVLRPGGIIRIAVPDLKKLVERYIETGDADAFIESTHLSVCRPSSLMQKLRWLIVGPRNHLWMYDGNSLSRLLARHGFVNVEVMCPGQTRIQDPGSLNLHERASGSVYVEAEKPSA